MKKYILFSIIVFSVFFIGTANGQQWSYISNGNVKLGVRLDWGASIAYFSRVSPEQNLVNYADRGREVQQSYYGTAYPGTPCINAPWMSSAIWNPVQAGDASGNSSTVSVFTNDGTSIYAKIIPKLYCSVNVDTGGYMEEWISLTGDVARIHNKFTYTGSEAQTFTTQETPAMFFDYNVPNLVYYQGNSPWTNSALTTAVPCHWSSGCPYFTMPPEKWAAYVDGSGWGIGAYLPHATSLLAYFSNDVSSGPTGWNTSYISAGIDFGFSPATPVYEYDVYLTIGTLDEIRSRFYAIHSGGSTITQTPYGGTAWPIPGTIQAEDYDNGGEGIAYHDTTSGNAGGVYRSDGVDIWGPLDSSYVIGGTQTGEWLEYTVNVASNGTYTIEARVSSEDSYGKFHIEMDGVDVTGQFTMPVYGGSLVWSTMSKTGVSLTAGQHIMRISLDSNGSGNLETANLNWVRFNQTVPVLPGWTFCANENEQCSFSGTKEVQYGASSQYFTGIFTNGVLCANSVFGDPIVGVAKYCYYRSDTTPPAAPSGVKVQ